MKFSLQEQNKKSRRGKIGPSSPLAENTTKWFNEHSNGKKVTFFNCGWFDFQHLFTGIEVFFQIVHFFFIDIALNHIVQNCCSERQNVFLCWGGSPRVPTHYPFIYCTIFWQKRYPFRKPIEKWYPSILLANSKSTFNELKWRKVGMFEIFWLKALNGWFSFQPTLWRTSAL